MRQDLSNETVLTISEAAKFLKVSKRHLFNLRQANQEPRFFKIGKSVRYPAEALRAFMQGETCTNTQEAR